MSGDFIPLSGLAALLTVASAPPSAGPPQASAKDQEAKLIAVLKSDAPRKAKADACRELGRIGTREAVAPLAALLSDPDLSHMARYGLEPIPDPAVDIALRAALDKVKGRPLVGIIGTIGMRRDPKAVPALIRRLSDGDHEVAQAAARSLGKIGTLEAATALEKALPTAPEANRLAICEGLFRCADTLRAQGQQIDTVKIYELMRTASVPDYVHQGASHAEELLRQREL
ncbi:MAG: HEAT repeat domain-containing protein [Planctomycetaceae bacterium]|nr:HEAT repeat domain-containing protein [Planctomycetaceae bacterium]